MVYITWVFQSNFKIELIKVIKFDIHNEINEITKENALMVMNERVVVVFSEIGCWYGFKARWCKVWFKTTTSTLDWLDKYIWYILNWVSNKSFTGNWSGGRFRIAVNIPIWTNKHLYWVINLPTSPISLHIPYNLVQDNSEYTRLAW